MSNFKAILSRHKGEDVAADEELAPDEKAAAPSPAPLAPPTPEPVVEPQPRTKSKPRVQAAEAPRRVGRPPGKRSDENHVQVTAYIRRDTHFGVKQVLLAEQKGRDFSVLVEELLAKWLKSRT
ncbi:hypothetical protein [Paludisphaera rhizosphaerae]|uniref:hypothetical protein n=1 Tax=Paludisphaera rhizosphaerae TaxID=2711216 RepID=UPI00197D9E62|nr:hypothetical protein [Paludisphaera rhizosphaerae]